jgi:U3 small nucleolar RNA-associated protein 12
MLPFTDVLRLMGYLPSWLEEGSAVELTTRVAALLLRLHHTQLVATASARPMLLRLHERLHPAVQVRASMLLLVLSFFLTIFVYP